MKIYPLWPFVYKIQHNSVLNHWVTFMEAKRNRLVVTKNFSIFLKQYSKQLNISRHTYKGTKIFTLYFFMWYAIKQFLY